MYRQGTLNCVIQTVKGFINFADPFSLQNAWLKKSNGFFVFIF